MTPPPTLTAPDLARRLQDLFLERALAETHGLDAQAGYMDDLRRDIEGCRDALVGAAVTEIATLRAELSGRLAG